MLNTARQAKERYSVLVMGRTQAGKSTLVEHIKNYANPTYAIDRSLLGNGNISKTESTRPFLIDSNLPTYEVYRKDTGEVIDLKDLAYQHEEEEDYRDILFSREKDMGMRMAPQDPNEPSEVVEFRFLDTPGLNDTNDRDSSHAVNIISEMINTRSFNLIIIIVSYKNPLTQEQQLALEYYANVFKGLHSRIMFLHTHVDYADVHHTNHAHHLNMKMKNKALSKMFRRFDSEGVPDEENVKEYSSLAIDLVSKKRPVINCLIRNTIREILKKATEPAAILDTSIQNIERIRAIIHPSKFNDDQRKKIKARFAAEAATLPKPAEEEQVDVGGEDLEQINILLIGDVQSGKTSLVETFRLYADPNYQAKTEHITQGNSQFADEKINTTTFISDLHTVQIRKLKASGGGYDVVDLEEEAKRLSEEDFEDLLNLGPKNAETVLIAPNNAKKYRFNIYEGPGLGTNAEDLEKNILSMNRILVTSELKFHQVLFTLAPGPITSAIRTTIQLCSDVFSNFVPFFSFVHTKISYAKLHVGNIQFQDSMKERQELLRRHVQSPAAPYLIDCDLTSNWPVQRAKTYNVVHDILTAATKQIPITLGRPTSRRTASMASGISYPSVLTALSSAPGILDTSIVSILVLGGQRSGKSSFVDHAKVLAGTMDGVFVERPPEASHISRTVFESSAPEYEVVRLRNWASLNVMHLHEMFGEDTTGSMEHHEILRSSEDKFFTKVISREGSYPTPKITKYAILDTPGINNSAQDDENIIKALVSTRSFNLILIAVSYLHPLTIELQLALEYYSKVLRGLHCNIAFLHTHVDYTECHPYNEDFYRNLKLRNLLLGRIFQTQSTPSEGDSRSHMIPKDDEMEEHPSFILELRPNEGSIIQGLNRNTLREILLLAAGSSPLEIDISKENLERILSIPQPRNLTDEEHKAAKLAILAEDERQKSVFITDDVLGQRYKVRNSLFHHTRAIYSKLVDV